MVVVLLYVFVDDGHVGSEFQVTVERGLVNVCEGEGGADPGERGGLY